MMINKINAALLCLTAALTLSSCLGGDDDTEYSFYDDAAVTAVTLGTLNRYLPDSNGNIVKTSYYGSSFYFSIDQEQGLIYNTDSLPYGTDAKHVLTTINTLNSGIVTIKNDEDGEYYYYVSTDSMDLSSERQVRVISQSGKYYRDYTLKLNVHQEDGEEFAWKSPMKNSAGNIVGNSDIAALQGMKAVNLNNKIYLFGCNGTNTVIHSSDQNDGNTWTAVTPNVTLDTQAYRNTMVFGDAMFILNDGALLRSTDGATWQTINSNTGLDMLVAASSWQIFGLSATEGFMASADGGNTWTTDAMENSNKAYIPTLAEGFACHTLKTNADMEQLVLVGKDSNGKTVIWTRLADKNTSSYTWCMTEASKETPQLNAISAFGYGDIDMMTGLKDGSATDILVSKDKGINWDVDSRYKLPAAITSNVFTTMVDSDNYIWLFYGQDGTVWRGRLNKMGWQKQD